MQYVASNFQNQEKHNLTSVDAFGLWVNILLCSEGNDDYRLHLEF